MNTVIVAMAIMLLSCGVMMAYSGKTKLKLLFTNKFAFILTVKILYGIRFDSAF